MPALETPTPVVRRSRERHRPEQTPLYAIVRDNLDAFLRDAGERSGRPLPEYVVREFREYLKCGILEYGFGHARCAACRREIVVAFSCKGRGLCPSCGARRMAGTGAFLVERVFPSVPVRQWVLSVPHPLRFLLAQRADLLTVVNRAFVDAVSRSYRARVATPKGARVACGAVTFVQRFGSLNLNVHLHVVFADGVFVRSAPDAIPEFVAAAPPDHASIEEVAARVAKRIIRTLRRKGILKEPDAAGEDLPNEPDALASCAQLALGGGEYAKLDERGRVVDVDDASDDRRFGRKKHDRFAAAVDGFDIHAGVSIAAPDREGRERLFRYGARPTISLSRMTILPDGRIAYRLKWTGPQRYTHRVMTPMQFLARAAALIPPPRYPVTRYHGVFAPNSKWRREVVPKAAETADGARCSGSATDVAPAEDDRERSPVPASKRPLLEGITNARIDWETLLRRV